MLKLFKIIININLPEWLKILVVFILKDLSIYSNLYLIADYFGLLFPNMFFIVFAIIFLYCFICIECAAPVNSIPMKVSLITV